MFSTLLVAGVLSGLAFADDSDVDVFTIINSCSQTISPQLSGVNNDVANPAPLVPGASTQVTLNAEFEGIIYANTGGSNDGQTGATKAGVALHSAYYYILIDSGFNMGISIGNLPAESEGFCATVTCATANCTTAFRSQPDVPMEPSPHSAPDPPLYECNDSDPIPFIVTFCPGGSPTLPVQIHPNGNNAKCLDVRAAVLADGTPVQIFDCNGSEAQNWVVNMADTKVQLAGTNFCLDAGTTPANNVGMKIWTCFDDLPAQAWFYTDDNRIAVTGTGQCLDLTNGNLANSNQVQTFQCTTGDTNQVWTTTS